MIATAILFLAYIVALGLGVAVAMVGATVAVLAQPGDRPIQISPRTAGVASTLFGLLVFTGAVTLLLDMMA